MPEIVGDSGNNTLNGTNGADIIRGLGGNDIIRGQGGLDELYGGADNDIYYIDDAAGDVVRELIGEGNDQVYVSVSYTLEANSEVELLSTNDYGSTAAINLTGNNLAQTIIGNAAANIIQGGGGADILNGLNGNDTYYVDIASVTIQESFGSGNDAVYSSVSYVLSGNAEVELLSTNSYGSTAAINLTGNGYNQTIIGNAGVNILHGGGGSDLLIGLGGNDIYYIDVASVTIQESPGGGTDTVYTSVSYGLTPGMDIEILSTNDHGATVSINLTGNGLANQLFGNAGSNAFVGGGGADVMSGFGGNDIYYVDVASVQIVESGGGGNDVVYASVSYTLANGVDVETLSSNNYSSTDALVLTGNSLGQGVVGNAGTNVLDGGLGNDTLVGLGGADTFAFTTALGRGQCRSDHRLRRRHGQDPARRRRRPALRRARHRHARARGTLVIGTAALDADDYLIYNSATGALLYDADGNGAGAAVQFATLSTGLSLTVADFVVSGPANNAAGDHLRRDRERRREQRGEHDRLPDDGERRRRRPDHLFAERRRRAPAHDRRQRRGPADRARRLRDQGRAIRSTSSPAIPASRPPRRVTLTITDVAEGGPHADHQRDRRRTTAPARHSRSTAARSIVATNANLLERRSALGDDRRQHLAAQRQGLLQHHAAGRRGADPRRRRTRSTPTRALAFVPDHLRQPNGHAIGDNDDPGLVRSGLAAAHRLATIPIRRSASGRRPAAPIISRSSSFVDEDTGQPTSQGAYQLNVSIGPPATAAQLVAEDVDALISGAAWNHTNLTYGFPTLASQYPSDFKEVSPPTEFSPFTRRAAGGDASSCCSSSPTSPPDLRGEQRAARARPICAIAMSSEAEVAYAYYPTNGGPDSEGGTAWFNHDQLQQSGQGQLCLDGHPARDRPRARPQARPRIPAGDQRRPRFASNIR